MKGAIDWKGGWPRADIYGGFRTIVIAQDAWKNALVSLVGYCHHGGPSEKATTLTALPNLEVKMLGNLTSLCISSGDYLVLCLGRNLILEMILDPALKLKC